MPALKPYGGYVRKLVLSFDIGTTFSGVGYAILDPGEVPKVQAVTRFPGQENGDAKIPTILYYTEGGEVVAAGAEARTASLELIEEDEDVIFVEWFKLHLRPDAMKKDPGLESTPKVPKLPPKKKAIDVYADFLRYLYGCARTYIIETHANGESLWNSVKDHTEVILSHPNGWEGLQQSQMRGAAVAASLVPDTTIGHQRVHFVTEGEASLNYCIHSGLATDAIETGQSVVIIDAGGGTVDLSTYHFVDSAPLVVEEIAPAGCIFQGSTRVNVEARTYLEEKLHGSKYSHELDVKAMLDHFEKSVKPTFKDPLMRSWIKFGTMRDQDPPYRIKNGQLALEGQVARCFEKSITAIVEAVQLQRSTASKPVSLAFLVGGYAASPWLFARLKELLGEMTLRLARPDSHTAKAVAEGAIWHYLGNIVSARIARFTYGVPCVREYDPRDHEHVARSDTILTLPSGELVISGCFGAILTKSTRIRDQQELSISLSQESSHVSACNSIRAEIMCYRGKHKDPQWMDVEPELFSVLCTIHADCSKVKKHRHIGPNGVCYRLSYEVVLSFGLTEMKAQIRWLDNGVEKRGPAKVVYDDDAIACRAN
ncbi:hypothetical protein BC835DRAFT_1417868 [Cytidiella melzeri]|nr:hypothetical protein BC835DRAFT_1417868 [Cytidiella melzeri]